MSKAYNIYLDFCFITTTVILILLGIVVIIFLADLIVANCLHSDILNDFDLIRRFRLPENLPKGQTPKNYTIFYYITSTPKERKFLKIDKEVRKPIPPEYEKRY